MKDKIFSYFLTFFISLDFVKIYNEEAFDMFQEKTLVRKRNISDVILMSIQIFNKGLIDKIIEEINLKATNLENSNIKLSLKEAFYRISEFDEIENSRFFQSISGKYSDKDFLNFDDIVPIKVLENENDYTLKFEEAINFFNRSFFKMYFLINTKNMENNNSLHFSFDIPFSNNQETIMIKGNKKIEYVLY